MPQPFSLFYSIYCGGIIELTNVPLQFMDLLKNVDTAELAKDKGWLWSRIEGINFGLRMSFAISFIVVRLVWWWPMAINIAIDWVMYLGVIFKGEQGWARHGPWLVAFNFLSIIVLTALQTFWGWLVIKGIAKALCGGKKAEDKDADTEEDGLRKKPSVGEVDVEAKPLLRNDSVSGA